MFDQLLESFKTAHRVNEEGGDESLPARAKKESAHPANTLTLRQNDGEWRVPAKDGKEDGAYYTNDRKDAVATARQMHPGKTIRIAVKDITEEVDEGSDDAATYSTKDIHVPWGNCKDLKLQQADLDSTPTQGPADEAIDALVQEPHIVEQLDAYDVEDIRKELEEYGAWDEEELADDEQNRKRLLWVLVGNVKEGQADKGYDTDESVPTETGV
jgi:hypothetical protein